MNILKGNPVHLLRVPWMSLLVCRLTLSCPSTSGENVTIWSMDCGFLENNERLGAATLDQLETRLRALLSPARVALSCTFSLNLPGQSPCGQWTYLLTNLLWWICSHRNYHELRCAFLRPWAAGLMPGEREEDARSLIPEVLIIPKPQKIVLICPEPSTGIPPKCCLPLYLIFAAGGLFLFWGEGVGSLFSH